MRNGQDPLEKRNFRTTSKAGILRYFSPRFTHTLKITQRYNESQQIPHRSPELGKKKKKKKCLGLQIRGTPSKSPRLWVKTRKYCTLK